MLIFLCYHDSSLLKRRIKQININQFYLQIKQISQLSMFTLSSLRKYSCLRISYLKSINEKLYKNTK